MKKVTLFFSGIIVVLLLVDYLGLYSCNTYECRESYNAVLLNTLILSGFGFIFSVLLIFMDGKVTQKWWKFARVALPIIFIISTIINMGFHHNNFGPFNMDNMFDIPALVTLYAIFAIGSFIQIWRGYKSK